MIRFNNYEITLSIKELNNLDFPMNLYGPLLGIFINNKLTWVERTIDASHKRKFYNKSDFYLSSYGEFTPGKWIYTRSREDQELFKKIYPKISYKEYIDMEKQEGERIFIG